MGVVLRFWSVSQTVGEKELPRYELGGTIESRNGGASDLVV